MGPPLGEGEGGTEGQSVGGMERGRECGNVGVCLTAGVFERGRMRKVG